MWWADRGGLYLAQTLNYNNIVSTLYLLKKNELNAAVRVQILSGSECKVKVAQVNKKKNICIDFEIFLDLNDFF